MGEQGRGGGGEEMIMRGSEWGGGRAGTWTGCYFNNLELGLAGLLMSGLFCDHLASASAVPGRLNSFAIELALVR